MAQWPIGHFISANVIASFFSLSVALLFCSKLNWTSNMVNGREGTHFDCGDGRTYTTYAMQKIF